MSKETQIASEEQEVETEAQEELKTEDEMSEETTDAPTVDEVDYEALLNSQEEIIAKLTTERDNYKKGMLKNKGKIKEEQEDVPLELSDDEKIRSIVRDEFYNSEIAKAQQKKDDIYKKALKRNKELEIALRNSGKANLSFGGGGAEETKKKEVISPALKANLIERANKLGVPSDKYIERYLININK